MPSRSRSSPEAGQGAGDSDEDGLGAAAADLYQLEPGKFVGARKELAAKARRDGDRDLAEQIAKLPRPSRAAAALNHLVHRHPEDVDRLLQLAHSLRDASERLAGSKLRELGSARRQLIAELVSSTVALESEHGNPPSGSIIEEIEESLQASLLDEEATRAVTSGCLVRSLRVAAVGSADLSMAVSLPPGRRLVRAPTEPGGAGPADDSPPEKGRRKGETTKLKPPGKAAAVRRREAAEAQEVRRREAAEAARRAATAAATAHKELERARTASERARTRREAAEAALAGACSEELASSKALRAAEAADRRARAAREVADAARRRLI